MFKRRIASALVFAALMASSGQALAHAHLKTQMPAADTVVSASPTALSLGFSEGLEIGLSGVTLKAADGQAITTGVAALAPDNDKQISVPLKAALATGKYTVEWHALSKDGHTSRGSYQFTVGQ